MEIYKDFTFNENNLKKTKCRRAEKKDLYQYISNFQKEFDRKLNYSKSKIKENQFQHKIEKLNKIISQKQGTKKTGSILNIPYVSKKQIRSKSSIINTAQINMEKKEDIKQLSRNKRNSNRVNSNFSLKVHMKNDMWELHNDKTHTPTKEMNIFRTYYEKEKHFLKVRDAEVEKLRDKKREDELKTLKDVPEICNYSLILLNEKEKYKKPLHKRLNEIKENKFNKINNIRRKLDEEYIIENKLNKLVERDDTYNKKRFNIWIKNMENWEKNKKKKIGLTKEKVETEKSFFESNLTFFPKLNKGFYGFSNSYMEEETSGKKRLEKLYNDFSVRREKYQKIRDEFTPTFKPKINKSLPNYIETSNVIKKRSRNSEFDTSYSRVISKESMNNSINSNRNNIKTRIVPQYIEGKSTKITEFINKRNTKDSIKVNHELHKNIKDNVSWDANKDNRLIYTPKFSEFMNSLIIEKTLKEKDLIDETSIQNVDSLYQSRGNLRSHFKLTV